MSSTTASTKPNSNNRNRSGSGPRRGGGGGRRRSRGGRNQGQHGPREERQPEAPVTESFTDKLLSFLTFGLYRKEAPKPASNRGRDDQRQERNRGGNQSRGAAPSGRRENREPREPREPRESREAREPREPRENREGAQSRDRDARRRPAQEPEQAPVTTERLYVGNLNYDATESDLYDLFNGVGQVRNAEVVCHRYTQRSKGYAFVEMTSVDEAKRAVEVLHDKDFMGRKLWISGAKSEGPKGEDARDEEE